jgi:hypothetical protein
MEMHMVHRNQKYPDMSSALGKLDGVAVFAVFFEVDPYNGKDDWIVDFKEFPMMPKARKYTACKMAIPWDL